jgi:hypothetical protein
VRRLALAAVLLLACHGSSSNGGELVSTTAATSGATVAHSSAPSPHPATPSKAPLCRAIAVTGPVHRVGTLSVPDAGAVKAGELAGPDYIDLGPGSKLSIKNGTTAREAVFEGTGAVKVCVGGEEEMWLPAGTFHSVAGAGESPGAEQWIVTPHGVIRYDAARVHVVVGVAYADVTLGSGSASVYPIDNAYRKAAADAGVRDAGREGVPIKAETGEGWIPVPEGQTIVLAARRSTSQIVTECEEAAKAAHDLAESIATRDAAIGDAAPKHVRLRQKARAVCAVGELAASRALDPVERERLLSRLHAATTMWRDNGTP